MYTCRRNCLEAGITRNVACVIVLICGIIGSTQAPAEVLNDGVFTRDFPELPNLPDRHEPRELPDHRDHSEHNNGGVFTKDFPELPNLPKEQPSQPGNTPAQGLNPNPEFGPSTVPDNTKFETLRAGTPAGNEHSGQKETAAETTSSVSEVSNTKPVFQDIPVKPTSSIPQNPVTDREKVEYAREVREFVRKYPASMYQETKIPGELTVQEEKILEAIEILESLPVSEGDKLVEKRDEKNAVSRIAQKALDDILKGNPEKVPTTVIKETEKETLLPSVVSDGTPLGQGNIQSLKKALGEERGKYDEMRGTGKYAPLVDKEKLSRDAEHANSTTPVLTEGPKQPIAPLKAPQGIRIVP